MGSENKVRQSRIREGLTQTELAEHARLSAKTVSRVEKGDNSVLDSTKHKLVKGFNKIEDKRRDYTFDFLFSQDSTA